MISGTVPEIKFHVAAVAINAANGNANDSGSNGFTFVVEDVATVLSVKLSDFSAKNIDQGTQLSWTTETETETDNQHFVIEHATDPHDFTAIQTIDGFGTTQDRHSYNFLHRTPANGTNYYRLKMVEFDGSTSYSKVVTIKKKAISNMIAYPQPATQFATLHLETQEQESVTIQVIDITGRTVYYKDIVLNQGENLIQLPCNAWTPNHYIVTVIGDKFGKESIRFIKKKYKFSNGFKK